MDNIHAPTIPSGPTSTARSNGDLSRLSFAEWQKKKENMEAELQALSSVLDSHGVNMETPLTTSDGFPRADIDVAQIRTTRARIIHLRNDYKELMNAIEKHLHEYFANVDTTDNVPASTELAGLSPAPDSSAPPTLDAPFAKVNSTAPNSPAESAGLRPGDFIRNFGYVNSTNHDGLRKVAECVQANESKTVVVKVSRPKMGGELEELQLSLTPSRDWGGRGLLGCHILPY